MKKTFSCCLVLFGLLLLQPVEGQRAESPRPAAPEQAQPVDDPLGRSTPQGTVLGLTEAATRGNLERAAEYLDSRLKPADRRELARKLGVVLDRELLTSAGQLSNRPAGDIQDGLPATRDRVGLVHGATGDVDIFVDRVQRGRADPVWLFSADTLREIPRLYDGIEPLWIEQYLPERLRTIRFLSIPLYRWMAVLLSIPLLFGLTALASRALTASLRPLRHRLNRGEDDRVPASLAPLRLLVLALMVYGASLFGVTLTVRNLGRGVASTLAVIALCWLSLRLIDILAGLTLERLQRIHQSEATALVRLISRLSKATAVVVAGLVLLYRSGIDLTTVLAGLGVGGLAIGFGAQRTIENLFGGIMVISDQPVNVGDVCRAGEFFGTVEDIGIRSTRIRTLDRTVVSIPNGQLAMMSLENYAVRDRIRLCHTIRLTLQTTPEQLRAVLLGSGRLLAAHHRIEADSARTRFIRFGRWSLDIEIVAYVLERDQTAFLAVQEEILIGLMDVIDASGTSVALPPGKMHPDDNREADV